MTVLQLSHLHFVVLVIIRPDLGLLDIFLERRLACVDIIAADILHPIRILNEELLNAFATGLLQSLELLFRLGHIVGHAGSHLVGLHNVVPAT